MLCGRWPLLPFLIFLFLPGDAPPCSSLLTLLQISLISFSGLYSVCSAQPLLSWCRSVTSQAGGAQIPAALIITHTQAVFLPWKQMIFKVRMAPLLGLCWIPCSDLPSAPLSTFDDHVYSLYFHIFRSLFQPLLNRWLVWRRCSSPLRVWFYIHKANVRLD